MKRRTLHIVQKKGGGSQMNTECTIGTEPGHCSCGMLTMDAKGHFGPSFFQLLENTETSGVAGRTGTRGTVICLCLAWKSGPPVYPFSRVFLEDGLSGPLRELGAPFSVICFCVKILKADRSVLQSVQNQLFLPCVEFSESLFSPLARD